MTIDRAEPGGDGGSQVWVEALRRRRLVPFVGAGVSMVPPSSLPGWLRFNQAVLEALAAVARPVIGPSAQQIVEKCLQAQASGRLPPEYSAELVVDRFGDGYFQVLQVLEGDQPNHVHRLLAAMLGTRRVPAVVTTSFDTLIEQACAEMGVPLKVLVLPDDYVPYAEVDRVRWHMDDKLAPGLLLKLHGTASQPQTCIDTLAQRKRGLPPEVTSAVRAFASQNQLLMLGFSGADLEAEPNYLGIRSLAAFPETPGFTWLHLPGSTPPPAVRTLAAVYGPERGRLVEGRLPEWLGPAEELLAGDHVHLPHAPIPAEELAARQAAAEADLNRRAQAWAQNIVETVRTTDRPLGTSPAWTAILLSDFATHVGQTELARGARRAVLDYTRAHEDKHESQAAVLIRVADDLAQQGSVQEAIDTYKLAFETFNALGSLEGLGATMVAYSVLLDHVGQFEIAERQYRTAMQLYREHDEIAGYVNATANFCNGLVRRGRAGEAEDLLREAVHLAALAGSEPDRTLALQNLAIAVNALGRPVEAGRLMDEADAVHARLGMEKRWAFGRIIRADFHTRAGEVDQSEQVLAEAAEVADRIAEWPILAAALQGRAKLMAETGRVIEAEPLVRRAIELRQRIGDRHGELAGIGILLTVWIHQGRFADVLREGPKVIEQAAGFGLVDAEISASINTGIACEMTGENDEAQRIYEQALATVTRIGDQATEAQIWGNLGNVLYRKQALPEAAEAYRRSTELFEALGDVPGGIRGFANRANVANALGDVDEAIRLGEQAVLLATGRGFGGLTALMYSNLGSFYWTKGDFGSAATAYERAAEGFSELGDRGSAGNAALMLAYAYLRTNQVHEADHAVRTSLELLDGLGHPQQPAAEELAQKLREHLASD